jgi:PmbA protein
MIQKDKAQKGLQIIQSKGAEKAHMMMYDFMKQELTVDSGNFSLLRTTFNNSVSFRVINEHKKGDYSANKLDDESLDKAAEAAIAMARASQADPAFDIAEKQPPAAFESGPDTPDRDLMYDRLKSFVATVKKKYPTTILEKAVIDFSNYNYYFMNTNDVNFFIKNGYYTFSTMFTSKEGKKASSFNYSHFCTKSLDKEFIECGTVRTLLDQSAEQTEMKNLDGKFDGEIIITPDCFGSFIGAFISAFITDFPLIAGTSILKDSLNKQVADSRFTIHSAPLSGELATNYYITSDGYKAENCTLIDKGILKTFLLTLYGANKTGKQRSVNNGGCYIIEPGNTPRDEMIQSVKKGLLVCRTSGGRPNDKGDFSTVAKNSYYIEDGKIQYPVNETMITGNIADMFMNIKAVSKECINFGTGIYPWVLVDNLTISGK